MTEYSHVGAGRDLVSLSFDSRFALIVNYNMTARNLFFMPVFSNHYVLPTLVMEEERSVENQTLTMITHNAHRKIYSYMWEVPPLQY